MLIVVIAPTAAAYDYVDRSHTIDFYSSDGGTSPGWGIFAGGYHHTNENRVEAWSNCISVGYGSTGWAYVFHIVECHATGYYKAELWGHYWGVGSAAGGADAFLRWDIRVEDINGQVHSGTIRMLEAIGFWAFNEQSDFYASFIFWGENAHTYRVGLYGYATTMGVVGSAIADGAGEQGAYFTHGRVSPYTQSGGGGGCIWSKSQVSMADGTTEKASQIKVGDEVLGYDIETGQTVTERVLSNTETHVDTIIDFNNGFLLTTPLDQPIYARNATYTGWVVDPLNLTIGWELFCPLSQTWVEITSMEYKTGNYKVNDIKTDVFDNYIANGVLVDAKTP